MSRKRFDIAMQQQELFERDCHVCICGNSIYAHGTPQLAHRIPQRKHLLAKYGEAIIHHPMNMASTCSLECNASVSIANDLGAILELLEGMYEYEVSNGNSVLAYEILSHVEDLRKKLGVPIK